jgi:hypothetical protein
LSSVSASLQSLTLAPVRDCVRGKPWPSTTRWCLEPFLPRSVGLEPVRGSPFCRHAEGVNGGTAPVDVALLSQLVQQAPSRAADASTSLHSRRRLPAAATPRAVPSAERKECHAGMRGHRTAGARPWADADAQATAEPPGSTRRRAQAHGSYPQERHPSILRQGF